MTLFVILVLVALVVAALALAWRIEVRGSDAIGALICQHNHANRELIDAHADALAAAQARHDSQLLAQVEAHRDSLLVFQTKSIEMLDAGLAERERLVNALLARNASEFGRLDQLAKLGADDLSGGAASRAARTDRLRPVDPPVDPRTGDEMVPVGMGG